MTPSNILHDAIAQGVFPGAVAYCARGDAVQFHGARGQLGIAPPFDVPVATDTIYDLASVTKIYVLAAALQSLRAHGIALDAPLCAFLPDFPAPLTLWHLMSHSSGLELHLQTLTEFDAGDWLPNIAAAPLVCVPGTQVNYLCTNYFLLGRALWAIEGASLESIVRKYVLQPAGLLAQFAPDERTNIAPTEADGQGGYYCGAAHDEAARSYREQTGDCAGNAGLFADAHDVAQFGALWWSDFFHGDDINAITARPLPEESGTRGLGFQIDTPFYMSDAAPPDSWGHLGFTGPSLVIHRASRSVIVLLNNRVHPTRNGPNRMPCHRALAAWSWRKGES